MVKKGFALITTLAVMIAVALGAAAILQAIGSTSNMRSNNIVDVQSQYLAEAGMQYALWQCRPVSDGGGGGCSDNLGYTIDGIAVPIDVTDDGSGNFTIQVAVNYGDI